MNAPGSTPPASKLPHDLQGMLQWLLPVARQAGQAILSIYDTAHAHPEGSHSALVQHKADQSPLTQADLAANHAIVAGLTAHAPDIVVISEESPDAERSRLMAQAVAARRSFWLVDPLDGTKEFLSGTGEFTVNIALIDAGRAVLGVVFQPTTGELFWGGEGVGAWRQVFVGGAGQQSKPEPLAVAPRSEPPWRVLASRSHLGPHTQAMIKRMGPTTLLQAGSSLKFCRIAMGQADFYPRLGFTSQWDTAAAQAVLEAAGGYVMNDQGQALRYGQPDIINPHFLASALPYEQVISWWRPVSR